MSRAIIERRFPRPSRIVFLVLALISLSSLTMRQTNANPLSDLAQEYQNLISESSTINSTDNSTEIAANTDVYVIKAIVYEIGILTDTDNTTTSESTERHERVDISLYDPPGQKDEFA